MTGTSGKDDKRKKKDKERDRDYERFDPNIDSDTVGPISPGSSSSKNDHGSGGSGKNNNGGSKSDSDKGLSNDMSALSKVLEKGFSNVSTTISLKLDDVSTQFKSSIENMQTKLDDRLTELAEGPGPTLSDRAGDSELDEADSIWEGQSVSGLSNKSLDRRSTHAISESSSNVDSDSFFKKKNKTPAEDRVGDPVDKDLAEIADRCFKKPLAEAEFKKNIQEKYVRPQNVEWIRTPEIPFSIYRRLPSDFKNTDKALKAVQDDLVPVGNSLIVALDKLGKGDVEGGMETLSDTLEGFGYVFRSDLSGKRRALLKPKLPEDFKQLVTDKCSPTPTNLLGDISENTKKISETDKITAQMDKSSKSSKDKSKKSSSHSGKPYDRNNNRGRGGFFNRRYDSNKRYSSNRQDYNSNRSDYRSSFRRGGQNKK